MLAFSKSPIFHDQKFFFEKTIFGREKIRFLEKAKTSKLFNFLPKIFQQQQMLKTLKCFSELQIYSKTCKKHFGGAILNKNNFQKTSKVEKDFPPES